MLFSFGGPTRWVFGHLRSILSLSPERCVVLVTKIEPSWPREINYTTLRGRLLLENPPLPNSKPCTKICVATAYDLWVLLIDDLIATGRLLTETRVKLSAS